MTDRNRVTEGALLPNEFWLVSAEWRGGHNKRKFQLENIHYTEKAALTDWERLTKENHNAQHNYAADYDSGFVRHPMRRFDATVKP